MGSKAMEQYLSRLKRALTCSRADRERLLSQGRRLLEDFLEENPEGGYEAMAAAFGPPEGFAGEMLATLDQEELKQTRARRKLLQRTAALFAAVVLVLCTVFYAVKWHQTQEVINDKFYEVEGDFVPMTEDEFNHLFGLNSNQTGGAQP